MTFELQLGRYAEFAGALLSLCGLPQHNHLRRSHGSLTKVPVLDGSSCVFDVADAMLQGILSMLHWV